MNKIDPNYKENFQAAVSLSYYTVQVGAFSKIENARRLANKLKALGYEAYLDELISGKGTVFKVKVGRFNNRGQAVSLDRELSHKGYPTKILP